MAKGEGHFKAKLTESDVLSIRERRAAGERVADIAAIYGVSAASVYQIAEGVTWKHVGGVRTRGMVRLLPDDEALYQRWAAGERQKDMAAALSVSRKIIGARINAAGGRARRNADIRKMYREDGMSQKKIGEAFGLGQGAVSSIILSELSA